MLRKISQSKVVSDEGFEVRDQFGFPPEFVYEEGNHVLRIPTDITHRPVTTVLVYFSDAEKWEKPHHLEVINAETREKIRHRLIEALNLLSGGSYRIE